MKEITKISEITADDVASYIRLDETTADDQNFLTTALNIAKTFIKSYTGRTEEELDNYPDFVIVAFVLCQDMYDNRSLYVDKTNLNKVVDTILGMHSVNLL
ncbi:head-tail connector protein [Megamonas hypermegale]|uniref:head-tail connector protein n=1 Tax=Megamonas hypermegale TaxID=158847 RepID=UPI0026EEF167|nr:head-tail connector protein [Megamonas hypermegale]